MAGAGKRAKAKSLALLAVKVVKINVLFIRYILWQISMATDLVAGPAGGSVAKAF